MSNPEIMRQVDAMFPRDQRAFGEGVNRLAREIKKLKEKVFKPEYDLQLVGIYLDGVPLSRAVHYSLHQNYSVDVAEPETVLMSSKLGLVDEPKIRELIGRGDKNIRVYVDRRTKTGSLGKMLGELDPMGIYAVLEDPNEKATVTASKAEVPWFNWPGNLLGLSPVKMARKTAPFIGMDVNVGPDGRYYYTSILGEPAKTFYKKLEDVIRIYK